MKKIKDLIIKLYDNNEKEEQKQFEEYVESLEKLYKEMLDALNKGKNYIDCNYLRDIAEELKFKVIRFCLIDGIVIDSQIIITKKGIKKITKEMIKYNLLESGSEE